MTKEMPTEELIEKRAGEIVAEIRFSVLQRVNGVNFERCVELFGLNMEELKLDLGQKILDLAQVDERKTKLFKEQLRATTVWTYPALKPLSNSLITSFGEPAGSLLITYEDNPAWLFPMVFFQKIARGY